MKDKFCMDCAYWEEGDQNWGVCHRYPPKLGDNPKLEPVLWPEPAPKDWCGEWKGRDD